MGRFGFTLVLWIAACGRVGFDSQPPAEIDAEDVVPGRVDADPTTSDAATSGADGSTTSGPPDASLDHPCRLSSNWICGQEGGGDCISRCTGPDGMYTLEILSFTSDYFCALPAAGGEVTCAAPSLGGCAGCNQMAEQECCFP